MIAWRGRPALIISDNGSGLTSMRSLRWAEERGIEWHYIAPGKPAQNAFAGPGSTRKAGSRSTAIRSRRSAPVGCGRAIKSSPRRKVENHFAIDLEGDLAGILTLASKGKTPSGQGVKNQLVDFIDVIKLVAGARNQRLLRIAESRIPKLAA